MSNWASLSTLASRIPGCVIVSDEANHASMIEGMRHSRAARRVFRHNDVADLRRVLSELPREALNAACLRRGVRVHYPELHLCTDNGAMIAMAAAMRLQSGQQQANRDYAFDVKPRWPLDALAACVQ